MLDFCVLSEGYDNKASFGHINNQPPQSWSLPKRKLGFQWIFGRLFANYEFSKYVSSVKKLKKNWLSDAKKYVYMPVNLVKAAIKGFCGHQGRKSSIAYANEIPTVCGTGLMSDAWCRPWQDHSSGAIRSYIQRWRSRFDYSMSFCNRSPTGRGREQRQETCDARTMDIDFQEKLLGLSVLSGNVSSCSIPNRYWILDPGCWIKDWKL